MASKTTDVDLRIRAKNLSRATLSEITDDIQRLTKAQEEQSSSSQLAAKSARDLAAAQQYLAAAERELARRAGLGDRYKEEQVQIEALAKKLKELTAARAAASAEGQSKSALGTLDRDIARTNKSMDQLVQKNTDTGNALRGLGVNVDSLDADLTELRTAVDAAGRAKAQAVADVQRYGNAVAENNAIIAEATRRTREQADAVAETAARNRQAAQVTGGRNAELAALRQDIEARSEATQKREVEVEAIRRTEAALGEETAARARNDAALRATVQALEEQRRKRLDATHAFTTQLTAQERSTRIENESAARKDRLVRLLNTERGQRILAAEAQRQETAALNANSTAQTRNAAATKNAADAQKLFNDRGRESLSTYQRVRGQVIGLITAYVGVYEAINTVTKAVAATNRDQSLRIGLQVGAEGNQALALKNYAMLRKEADRLGLVFDDVAPKFVNLDIAGQKAGLTAEQTAKAFKNLAFAASARNLSVDDTEGAFRAVEQMFSKGKVQAEELRGQLAERLPGAVAIFAKASGMSLKELDKNLEQGRVGLDFVVRGLNAYAEQFDSNMGEITERLSAYINRAKNAYNDWLRTLMNGENQNRLKEALSVVTEFFQGKDGQAFAEALGKAFAALVDTFIWLAKNLDTVTLALKAFVAVQAIKFLLDLAVSVKAAGTAFVAFRAQVALAATQTGAMATAARGLTVLFGPLGVAIAGTFAMWSSYQKYVSDAESATNDFIDTLDRARKSQGSFEIGKSIGDIDKQIKEVDQQLGDALNQRDALLGLKGIGGLTATMKGLFGGAALTVEEAELDIAAAQEKQNALAQARLNLQERQLRATREEAAERDRLAKQDLPTVDPKAAKTPKVAAGPDPDSVRDRILKMTEDLRSKLAQTEVQSNARTMAQIEANYQARLAIIKTEVAKAEVDIAAIQRAAAASNKGKGTDVTSQLTTLKATLEAYKAAANERAQEEKTVAAINLQEKQLNDYIDQRAAKLELINTLQQTGAITVGEAWDAAFKTNEEYNARIREQIDGFLTMLQAIPADSDLYARLGVAKLISGLKQARAEAVATQGAVKQIGLVLANDVAAGGADALVTLGKGLAGFIEGANSLGDAFKGAMDAFRTFAADFLQKIAQMIIQAIILQAIQNAINGTSGGYGGAIMSAFGTRHQGGVIGGAQGTNPTRMVSPMVFAGAQRFHSGGLPGLRPNEVPTILERGEEVVTADNPRHVNNAGPGNAAEPSVTVINQFKSEDVLKAALDSPQGRKTLTAFISSNRQGVRAALGTG